MFLTIKLYLHLNCELLLNWIVWNGTVFDIETVISQNWIVIYRTVLTFNCVPTKLAELNCLNKLNSLKQKCFWQLNWVLMLNWIVRNRTDNLDKNGYGVK